jgi:hypothetical protein
MQQRRYTVTISFTEAQAEQLGSLATEVGVPVAAVVKLAALQGLAHVTPRTLEAARQSGQVRTTGSRRPWPGTERVEADGLTGEVRRG